jgi:hypothetical protein
MIEILICLSSLHGFKGTRELFLILFSYRSSIPLCFGRVMRLRFVFELSKVSHVRIHILTFAILSTVWWQFVSEALLTNAFLTLKIQIGFFIYLASISLCIRYDIISGITKYIFLFFFLKSVEELNSSLSGTSQSSTLIWFLLHGKHLLYRQHTKQWR